MQLWQLTLVQGERDGAVFCRIDDEIGRNLLQVATLCFSHSCTGFRIQMVYFLLDISNLFTGKMHGLSYLLPMFLGESIEVLFQHLPCQQSDVGSFAAVNL